MIVFEYSYFVVDLDIFLKSWVKKVFKLDMSAMIVFAFAFVELLFFMKTSTSLVVDISFVMRVESILMNFLFDIIRASSSLTKTNQVFIKYINFDDVTFYDVTKAIRKQLIAIAKVFSLLWQDTNQTINLLEQEWMSIILKSKIKIDVAKINFLDSTNKEFLD